jgi:hypothetical protein
MTKISDALTFGLTIRESADDGSDFTNPAADYRRLFLGEDGQLHVKDSAGAVTDIGAGSVATDAIWDAKGDIAVATAANTAQKLTVGATDGHVLTIDAAQTTGLKWAAAAAGGITRTTLGTLTDGGSYEDATGKAFLKKVTLATDGFLASIMVWAYGNVSYGEGAGAGLLSDNAGSPYRAITAGLPVYKDSDGLTLITIGMDTNVRQITIPVGAWLAAGDYWLVAYFIARAAGKVYIAYAGSGSDKTQNAGWPADVAIWGTSNTSNNYSIAANILR